VTTNGKWSQCKKSKSELEEITEENKRSYVQIRKILNNIYKEKPFVRMFWGQAIFAC